MHRKVVRTLGIAAWPLNRLRTRLSIPLGLRHEGSTPSHGQYCCPSLVYPFSLTFEAVGLVAVEALGVCVVFRQLRIFEMRTFRCGVRFLTIGTCFLAATIFLIVSECVESNCEAYALCLLLGLVVVTISSFEASIFERQRCACQAHASKRKSTWALAMDDACEQQHQTPCVMDTASWRIQSKNCPQYCVTSISSDSSDIGQKPMRA
jgi:hypothetical protein